MKWLILKFLMWFHLRRWNHRVDLVAASTDSKKLDCILLAECLPAFNRILIEGVPREQYLEYHLVTSTASILDVRRWLEGYLHTLRTYVAYQQAYLIDPRTERPEESYLSDYQVTLSEPMRISLYEYMRSGSDEYSTNTLTHILGQCQSAAAELRLITDEIEYEYFTRRASYVVDDVWAVLTTFIKANKTL